MITYVFLGAAPAGLPAALLERVGSSFRGVAGLPKEGTVGIRSVTRQKMQQLNKQFRKKDRPTDVLSFSTREGKAVPGSARLPGPVELGDIVLCPAVAREEARRRGMDTTEELVRLVVHGTLHLAGMDHATAVDEERMFSLQERIIGRVIE